MDTWPVESYPYHGATPPRNGVGPRRGGRRQDLHGDARLHDQRRRRSVAGGLGRGRRGRDRGDGRDLHPDREPRARDGLNGQLHGGGRRRRGLPPARQRRREGARNPGRPDLGERHGPDRGGLDRRAGRRGDAHPRRRRELPAGHRLGNRDGVGRRRHHRPDALDLGRASFRGREHAVHHYAFGALARAGVLRRKDARQHAALGDGGHGLHAQPVEREPLPAVLSPRAYDAPALDQDLERRARRPRRDLRDGAVQPARRDHRRRGGGRDDHQRRSAAGGVPRALRAHGGRAGARWHRRAHGGGPHARPRGHDRRACTELRSVRRRGARPAGSGPCGYIRHGRYGWWCGAATAPPSPSTAR